ncbi:uncharacterized protein cubi_01094 [Cryptosporidium ubiquitum]|uniref:C2H2-type domain-containing protein n=1 Tax=Cryptosporidium ubiquitum TaxID=857276 RepID=A0A1J4MJ15_9CRYT|nr:uncharacterized protein cubi_01094 [Cryptosporidium ubiquitum]OII74250.1 hypothetical protein cubi_01094 [Cryptosporidium ubiquitum]
MLKNNQLRNRKIRKLDNYCNVCGKGFINHDKYTCHILYSHITCNEENCDYSAPKEIMYYHKLKHINNNEGNSITESAEEIEKWLICRKMRFPKSNCSIKSDLLKSKDSNETQLDNGKKKIKDTQISALEHYIRMNMTQQAPSIHNVKLNKFSNKKNYNCNTNIKVRTNKKKIFQENKKVPKSLLFRLFENEICIYERKMISAINYILKSFCNANHFN